MWPEGKPFSMHLGTMNASFWVRIETFSPISCWQFITFLLFRWTMQHEELAGEKDSSHAVASNICCVCKLITRKKENKSIMMQHCFRWQRRPHISVNFQKTIAASTTETHRSITITLIESHSRDSISWLAGEIETQLPKEIEKGRPYGDAIKTIELKCFGLEKYSTRELRSQSPDEYVKTVVRLLIIDAHLRIFVECLRLIIRAAIISNPTADIDDPSFRHDRVYGFSPIWSSLSSHLPRVLEAQLAWTGRPAIRRWGGN